MKQNQLITKTLVVVALLLVGSSSTYAQFGNLLNRAKNAAKREAVKQANDAQWEAKNKALREVNEKKREELFEIIQKDATWFSIVRPLANSASRTSIEISTYSVSVLPEASM